MAAGSFAMAMTSCQHASTQNTSGTADPINQPWTQLIQKITKTIRGGFGSTAPPNGPISRGEEEDERYEEGGAGE
jgi:type IV secretory pathway VirB2 component (pilin)